ncbi:helix-turn-helix domain-containing protein [Streptomyces sp. t39]|nr:helix-turn-helix domain-containing protein [Streptomyces sp. t39]
MAGDAFTQIRNALFRDPRLSLKDKGLFGLISTHRDGWGVTPESLATCCTDGVSGIKTALRNLERYGYLKRDRERRRDGTLGSSAYYITDQPEAILGLSGVDLRRSEPTDDSPPVAEPSMAEPTMVDRPHKKTNSNETKGKKTTSPHPSAAHQQAADPVSGGGGNAPQQQDQNSAAAAFVDTLPYRGRTPGPKQRAHLIRQVADAFAAGWTDGKLHKQLTEETTNAKSLSAVYRHRLEPENLPAVSVVGATVPAQRPKTVVDHSEGLRPECNDCGRPIPAGSSTTVCIDCREDVPA